MLVIILLILLKLNPKMDFVFCKNLIHVKFAFQDLLYFPINIASAQLVHLDPTKMATELGGAFRALLVGLLLD